MVSLFVLGRRAASAHLRGLGQAGFVAKKLCPHLLFVPLNFPLYTAASKEIFTILRQYGDMSPASLDEACVYSFPPHVQSPADPRSPQTCVARLGVECRQSITKAAVLPHRILSLQLCDACRSCSTHARASQEGDWCVAAASFCSPRLLTARSAGLTVSAGVSPNSMISKVPQSLQREMPV